ncbi:MAG: hypothetical protein ACI8TQ_001532 [Planctomycetota bacterium]|jgi:hypothetical protein
MIVRTSNTRMWKLAFVFPTVLLALGFCPSRVQADETVPGEVLIQLIQGAVDSEQVDSEKLYKSVERLGPEILPVLFAVLDTGIIPSVTGAQLLPEEIVSALWASFASIPESDLRRHVSQFADARYKERTRRTALKVLGSFGRTRDLDLLGQLSAPEGSSPSSAIGKSFGYAITNFFERDPRALREIQQLYINIHGSLRPTLIERIGRSASPERLSILSAILGRVPLSDPQVLNQIGVIASSGRGTSDEYVRGSVRAYLMEKDPLIVQIAAKTAGVLRDEGAISQLIDIVASDNVQTSPTAVRALIRICGHNFGTDARRWEHWYSREKAWWQSEASQVFRKLRHSDPGEVAASIQLLSTHTLYREELATELLCVLDRKEPGLRKLGCVILGSLGAEGARNGLILLLEDPDLEVRLAAKAAVSRLTFRVIPSR